MDWPLRVTMMTSSLSVARQTETSSSPVGQVHGDEAAGAHLVKFSTAVFLTSPSLVAMTMKLPGIRPVVATIAVTFSPSVMESRLMIARPLEVRELPAGISWHLR